MKHTILTLLLLLQSVSAFAATYYVATNGNNGNSGSSSSPWLTIQYAADRVSPGDTVIVRNGTYSPFHITRDGTSGNRIIIRSENALGATINGSESYGGRDAGIHITSEYITIDGFNVACSGSPASNPGERGIRLSGDSSNFKEAVIIRNNKVTGAGWVGITTSYANDVIVENNEVSNAIVQHGIYIANSGDRPIVRGNIIHSNNQAGLHMNGDGDSPGDGVISHAIVENNIIYNNSSGASSSAINMDGVNYSIIRNNLLFNNHSQGITNFRGDSNLASTDNQILNNTIIMSSPAYHALKFRNGSINGYVRNNIIIQQGTGDALALDNESMPGIDSDYNIIIHTTSSGAAIENYSGLSDWQSSTGQDQNSFTVTGSSTTDILSKIFVNPVNDFNTADYSLNSTSSAINAGITVEDASKDINDYNRPLGSAFDIGAYEYGGSDIMPTPQNVRIDEN